MSALIGHAKAARILGEAFQLRARRKLIDDQAREAAILLQEIGQAHLDAADAMEAAMRAEATGNQGEGT